MKFKTLLLAVVAAFFGTSTSNAQIASTDQCNTVAIVQDGLTLYVASTEGIITFDLKNFETQNLDAVGRVRAMNMCNGQLWYTADNKGLSRINSDGTTTTFTADNGLKNSYYNFMRSIASDNSGNVWAGGWEYFYKVSDGDNVTAFKCSEASNVRWDALALSPDGKMWIGGQDKNSLVTIGYIDEAAADVNYLDASFMNAAGTSKVFNDVTRIAFDSSSKMWLGSAYDGIGSFARGKFEVIYKSSENDLISNTVTGLCITGNDQLFFGSGKNLQMYDQSTFYRLGTVPSEAKGDEITTVVPEGNNVWIGMSKSGVWHYNSETGAFDQLVSGTIIDGINTVTTDAAEAPTNDATYDISGRRVKNLQKGSLYIKNGRTFLAR